MWSRNIIRKEAGAGGRKSCEPNEEITEIGLFALLNAIHAFIWLVSMCNLLWLFFALFCFPDSFSLPDSVWIMLWVRLSSHGPTVDTCESLHSNMDYVCHVYAVCLDGYSSTETKLITSFHSIKWAMFGKRSLMLHSIEFYVKMSNLLILVPAFGFYL